MGSGSAWNRVLLGLEEGECDALTCGVQGSARERMGLGCQQQRGERGEGRGPWEALGRAVGRARDAGGKAGRGAG